MGEIPYSNPPAPDGGSYRWSVAREGTPFVGRRAELHAVRQLLARLARGRGAALVIIGEAGVGKTRLLDEAQRLAAASGTLVARAVALPLTTQLPRDVVTELLESLQSAGRVRSLRLPAGAAAFRALVTRLTQAAAAGPLCLAVDDAHWSDAATIDLLQYSMARMADVPVGWLVASRPAGTFASIAHDLVARGLAIAAELQPFSVSETEALLRAHLSETGLGGMSVMLQERTGGNPLLLTEVIRASLVSDRSGEPPEAGELSRMVPGSVSDWLAGRLALLPAADSDLLSWVALLPEPVQLRWLAGLRPNLAGPTLQDGLARLVAERMLEDAADGFRFRHALIRDAAAARLPPGEYRRRCAAAAGVLGDEPDQVRAPLLEAAGRDGEAAAMYLKLAAEALDRGGGQDAARLFHHAGALAERAGQAGIRLEAAGGQVLALLHAARKNEAADVAARLLRDLRASGEDTRRLAFLTRYALALEDYASDLDGAVAAIREAEPLTRHVTGPLLAEALLAQAFVVTMAGRPAEAVPGAERAVQVARELGDPVLEARALNRLGLAVGQAVAAGKGMEILRRALTLADQRGLSTEAALACLNLSYLATICNDIEAMRDWALRGLAIPGLTANLESVLRSNAGDALMLLGDLGGALAYAVSARAVAAVVGPLAEDRVAVSHANVLALRGDIAQARRVLGPLQFLPGCLDHHRLLEVRAVVDEEDGKLASALGGYQEAAADLGYPNSAWCLAGVVRTAASLGEPAIARDAASKLERQAGRWPAAAWLSSASRAWMALAAGDSASTAGLFSAAADACSEAFERARLTLAAGLAGHSREQIHQAYDSFTRMGARLAAQRARSAARREGISIGGAASRRGPLTSRELEVALLIAAGRTNAEIAAELFISARTVEHHVEHILAKLGYRSRVDIAALVAAGQLPAGG